MIVVNVRMSKETLDYYSNYKLDDILNTLLDKYDVTTLPEMSKGHSEIQRKVSIYNEYYIKLYDLLGPKNKKVSLGRLLEFGKTVDILNQNFVLTKNVTSNQMRADICLKKAYKLLLEAYTYNNNLEKLVNEVKKYV